MGEDYPVSIYDTFQQGNVPQSCRRATRVNVTDADNSTPPTYLSPGTPFDVFSFEIDEEQVVETTAGDLERTYASLGESEQLDEYVLVSHALCTQRPSLILVEARQLDYGGVSHTQVKWSEHGCVRHTCPAIFSKEPTSPTAVVVFNRPQFQQSIELGQDAAFKRLRFLSLGIYIQMKELNVRNLGTGGHCIVRRTWMRVAMTQEDIVRLSPSASG